MNGSLGVMSATVYQQALIRLHVRPEHQCGELGEVVWPGMSEAANDPHYFGPLAA